VERKVEFFRHGINETDINAVIAVLKTPFLTTGPKVKEFEEKFASYLNVNEVVGLTSCTGALHLALLRHNIGPGDEVITTPMTFVATATAIIETGATPVFVDVSLENGLITPESAEKAITKKTKAIIPVHLYGRMVDMRGFAELAQKHGLILIEDAAHSIEAERDGVRPGQVSHAACFSFYATKGMTCGEGGAIACMSEEDAAWYKSARHHGISRNAAYRYTKKYEHWDMETMGWKYNMDDIQASLLINQIDRLDKNRMKREDLVRVYMGNLLKVSGLHMMEMTSPKEKSGCHLFTILVPEKVHRDEVLHALQDRGIGCAVNYRSVHCLHYFSHQYGYQPGDFPVSYEIGTRTITLPLYPDLPEDDVHYVVRTLKEILA
jgi:dTDP-4-amino-4,6-dideoxygalactose transaminase